MGGMLLEGLGRYRQYYREGLQDKLGVDVHLFKVGEYKSAAEPYVLDAASPEAKEADLFWMNDVWQRYLGDVAKARKLDAAQLAAGIDTLPAGIAAAERRPRQVRAAAEAGRRPEDARGGRGPADRARRRRRGCRGRFPPGARSTTTSSTSTAALLAGRRSARRWRWSSPKARSPAASSRRAPSAASRPRRCCARRATTNTSRRWCCAWIRRAAKCSRPSRSAARSSR